MGAEAVAGEWLSVDLQQPQLVKPVERVAEQDYFLSNLDQNVAIVMKTIYVFEGSKGSQQAGGGGDEQQHHHQERGGVVEVLRDGLSKVLVHYFPLAGRLGISPEGKLHIEFRNQGVVFVEAEAKQARVSEIGDIIRPDPALLRLVYQPPNAKNILDIPPMTVQVTRFSCGGVVLGLCINHCMFDGIGAMEFVHSWAELCRGAQRLSCPPFLDRTILRARNPPRVLFPHLEYAEVELLSNNSKNSHKNNSNNNAAVAAEELQYGVFTFSEEQLHCLKRSVDEEEEEQEEEEEDVTIECQVEANGTGHHSLTDDQLLLNPPSAAAAGLQDDDHRQQKQQQQQQQRQQQKQQGKRKPTTTFEAMAGVVWRARTEAQNMPPEQASKLLFAVDYRRRVKPELPAGFMGNGIMLTCAMAAAGEVAAMGLGGAAAAVRAAVARIDDAYVRSSIDAFELHRFCPSLASTLLLSTWSRLAFNSTDFGFGTPARCGPVGFSEPDVCLFLPQLSSSANNGLNNSSSNGFNSSISSNGFNSSSKNSSNSSSGGFNVLLALPPPAMAAFTAALHRAFALAASSSYSKKKLMSSRMMMMDLTIGMTATTISNNASSKQLVSSSPLEGDGQQVQQEEQGVVVGNDRAC